MKSLKSRIAGLRSVTGGLEASPHPFQSLRHLGAVYGLEKAKERHHVHQPSQGVANWLR
jgi:hypothetical protein